MKVFFEVIGKEPAVVTTADVFAFLSAQPAPRRGERVVRLEDGEVYYFCSPGCRDRFTADAASFAAQDTRS